MRAPPPASVSEAAEAAAADWLKVHSALAGLVSQSVARQRDGHTDELGRWSVLSSLVGVGCACVVTVPGFDGCASQLASRRVGEISSSIVVRSDILNRLT